MVSALHFSHNTRLSEVTLSYMFEFMLVAVAELYKKIYAFVARSFCTVLVFCCVDILLRLCLVSFCAHLCLRCLMVALAVPMRSVLAVPGEATCQRAVTAGQRGFASKVQLLCSTYSSSAQRGMIQ